MTARRACEVALAAYMLLYALAFALFLIGAFGLFGSPQGPLAGVFLVVLGLPWTTMLDPMPTVLRPWAAGLALLLNAGLLALFCRLRSLR